MNRRVLVLGIGAAIVLPLSAHGQEGTKVPRMARVGFFTPQSHNPPWIEAFRSGLREHGYFEGRNAIVELRSADGKKENYPRMMAELFAFKPDVLMLDMIRPEKDGIDVLNEVLLTGIPVKVVLTSGFSDSYLRLAEGVARFHDNPNVAVLRKPFRRDELTRLLTDLTAD